MRKKFPPMLIAPLVAIATGAALSGYEGNELTSYPDSGGVYTICKGITYIPGIGPVTKDMKLTEAQCADLNKAISEGFTYKVAGLLKVNMSVDSQTAHTTFAYNVGIPGYSTSLALKLTNQGRYEEGCRAMGNWYRAGGKDCRIKANGCPGLITRRKSEIEQCLSGS